MTYIQFMIHNKSRCQELVKQMDSIGSSERTEFKQHIVILLHQKDQLQSGLNRTTYKGSPL